jgi:hypothetical protein
MGPVAFQLAEHFSAEMAKHIEDGSAEIEQEVAEKFEERAKRHGWVASVQIPPCGSDVSRKRAENTIELAVALMKVFFGIPHSKGMRLPHIAAHRDREAYLLIQEGSKITWQWDGPSLEAALVADGWLNQIHEVYRYAVAHLLHESTLGHHSEIAARIADATRWYNDVSFENAAGVQVVKLVAALERLTVTGQFEIHKFCKRVALLASTSDKEEEMAEAYRKARKAHRLRDEVMHGSASQNDPKFAKDVLMVHDLTRYAVMSSLEMYLGFGGSRKPSEKKHVRSFFESKERPLLKVFHTVRQEFPVPKAMHVTLDPYSEQLVRRELEQGAFAEPRNVVAHALRLLDAPTNLDELSTRLVRP